MNQKIINLIAHSKKLKRLGPLKKHSDYPILVTATKYLPEQCSVSRRLWHVINDIHEIPKCVVCNKKEAIWNKLKGGSYRETCSPECSSNNPNKYKRIKETNLIKYGSESPFGNKLVQLKAANTIKTRYGISNASHMSIPQHALTLLSDKKWIHEQHFLRKLSLITIANNLNVSDVTVGNYLRKHGYTTQQYSQSIGECQLNQFINDLGIPTIQNTRSVIPPLELDIYIPNHNIAIEYCGLYWHSEQAGKNKHYHKNKYDLCYNQGIQLLTIFEDEWFNRKSQVQNKLKSLLQLLPNSIYGRQTNIITVPLTKKRDFFNKHHIQGNGPGSITIGLVHNNQLVACMSFKRRSAHVFELTRYATSDRIVGGFTKLLTHFQRNYSWDKIISFADLRWSNGNMYQQTGWELDKTILPDYYYSPDGVTRFHKFNYRRKYLAKLLKNFNPNLSECKNCDNNGIYRIWDCGKQRWIINNTCSI